MKSSYEVDPNAKEAWISGAYDRPSFAQSAYDSAQQAGAAFISEIYSGIEKGSNWFQKTMDLPNSPAPIFEQNRKDLDEFANSFNISTENPNLTTIQKVTDFAAGFISSNIIAAPLFGVGGEAFEMGAYGVSKIPYLGPITSKVGATKVLGSELGSIAKSAAGGAAVGMFGGIKEATAMGALAATLHVAPYAVGKIFGKIRDKYRGPGSAEQTIPNSPMPEVPEPGKPINETFIHQNVDDGTITAEEGEILKAYATDPENPEIQNKIANYLVREGHPVDVFNKRVMFEMMSSQDIDNLTHAVSEQLMSAGGKAADTSLSDYVVNKSLDNLRDNKMHMLDGLDGYIKYLDRELGNKPEKIAQLENYVTNAKDEAATISDIKQAKTQLEKTYQKQEALKNIVQTYTKLMRANVGRFSDQSKVLDYIKNKQRSGEASTNEALKPMDPIKVDMLPTAKPRVKVTEQGMEKIDKPKGEEPKDEVDQMMQDLMKQVKSSESKLALEEFTKDKEKFDQFRKSGSKLQNLIDCVVRNI